jgi:hypothetical protein
MPRTLNISSSELIASVDSLNYFSSDPILVLLNSKEESLRDIFLECAISLICFMKEGGPVKYRSAKGD